MSARTRTLAQVEGAQQVLVAASILWFAIAVSSIDVLNIPIARAVRWAALGELALVAILYALLRGSMRAVRLPVQITALFVALILLSASWSSDPELTFGRGLSFALVLVAAAAIAVGAAGRPLGVGQVLLAVLAGAVLVALAGLVVLAVMPDRAVVPATIGTPARFNGLGGNPNTMAMVHAVALPLAVWAGLDVPGRGGKTVAAAAFLLLFGSIVASGSRGALGGALAALIAFALVASASRRTRLLGAAGAVALVAVGLAVTQLPPRAERDPELNPEFGKTLPLSDQDAQFILPLENEIGYPTPGRRPRPRSLLETSGRLPGWTGAVRQAADRPVAGYGFGLEEKVFVDRYYFLYASRPENSYVGMLLQLGAVGVLSLLAVLLALARSGLRGLSDMAPERRRLVAACLGAVTAGAVLAVTQSFLTSAGSPATLPFWLCAFLLPAAAAPSAPQKQRSRPHEGEAGEREEEPAHRDREAGLNVM